MYVESSAVDPANRFCSQVWFVSSTEVETPALSRAAPCARATDDETTMGAAIPNASAKRAMVIANASLRSCKGDLRGGEGRESIRAADFSAFLRLRAHPGYSFPALDPARAPGCGMMWGAFPCRTQRFLRLSQGE